jgi:hypothetical protein
MKVLIVINIAQASNFLFLKTGSRKRISDVCTIINNYNCFKLPNLTITSVERSFEKRLRCFLQISQTYLEDSPITEL